jgi:ATP-binding cassette, subfamily B, bacterial
MAKTTEERTGRKLWDKNAWQGTSFFLKYLRPHKAVFIPALFALAITAMMSILFFYLLGGLVGKVLDGTRGPGLLEDSNRTTLLVIACAGGQAFIAFWRIWLFAKASERALASLRMDLFSRVIRLPMTALSRHRVGELASRLSNDVETMRETLVATIPQLIRHTVMLAASIVIIFMMSVKLSMFMLACIPVVIVLIAIFGARIRKLTRKAQDDLAQSQVVVDESLQAIMSVKAFSNEPFEISRYRRFMDTFLSTAIRASLPRALFVAFIIFSFSVALVLVVWFATRMVNNGEIAQEQLLKFSLFSGLVGASFFNFPDLITQLQRSLGATERVREILAEDMEPEAVAQFEHLRGDIEMRQVGFSYPSRPDAVVLKDFSFKAAAGQRIALVGPSGAGKSTVVSLLFRFYEPTEGAILVDGKPAGAMPLSALRRNLALVPQEVLLFGGTIRENIAYGKPGASEEEIVSAARQANAEQFITKLPEGYDTLVGERGAQLSGGQRQRVAIARAILADPAILILDEATSSLDAESERLVQEALDKLMANRTSIIIAHRLSTVRRADQILVLSAGTVIERGTHDELVANEHSLYATLAKLQLE